MGFGTGDEEQNEAYETLEQLLGVPEEEPEEVGREEAMKASIAGPKRIEVDVIQSHSPQIKRRIVVTDVMPPEGEFRHYSLSGRIKVCTTGKYETKISTGMSDQNWKITRVETYAGGYSHLSTVLYNEGTRQEEAWKRVYDFYHKLQPAEKRVIENWDTGAASSVLDDDEDDLYAGYAGYPGYGHGGGHYYQRTPQAYKPIVADVRVCGDEIGAKLYREQAEKEVQQPDEVQGIDIRAYLDAQDLREKKEEAGAEAEEAPATSTPATTDISKGDSGNGSAGRGRPSAPCSVCGSPICMGCLERHNVPGEGGWENVPGYVNLSREKGKPTIH